MKHLTEETNYLLMDSSPSPSFFSDIQSEDNNDPSLGLHQVFLAGVSVSSQKKGLISGKKILVVLIKQFCDKGLGTGSEWSQLCFLY